MAKRKKKRSPIKRILRGLLFLHLYFWGIIALLCILYNFINPPVTPLMIERYLLRGYPIYKQDYIPLAKIPANTQAMLIALEDGNFYKHFGFEYSMIKTAYQKNKAAGKIRFGASTITNQAARSIFLSTHRNYFRKYLEVQVSLIMEIFLSKKRILELYFNYVEWGRGIYGLQTASTAYFGKSAARLNKAQSKRMLVILTNPISYTPHSWQKSASARQRMQLLDKYF